MNINSVYIAKVYNIIEMCWDFPNYPTLRIKEKYETLVYIRIDEDGNRHFIDLQTGTEYYTYSELKNHKTVNEYIEIEQFPKLSKKLDIKRNNMSKKRILRKYNDNIKNIKNTRK